MRTMRNDIPGPGVECFGAARVIVSLILGANETATDLYVARHAGTDHARVSLTATGRELVLCVEDQGAGFEGASCGAPGAMNSPGCLMA